MSNRIFIPELKKEYVLAEDATILLYPFNYTIDDIESHQFYAKYTKGQMTTTQKREYVPLIGNEKLVTEHHVNKMTMQDWFMVSQLDFPPSVLKLVKTPFDLAHLDPQGTVYLLAEEQIQWTHRRFFTFIPKKKKTPYKFRPLPDASKRIVPEIKSLTGLDDSQIMEERYVWETAQTLNPLLDKMKGNYIPIHYTFPKGSTFSIEQMNHKESPDNKTQVVSIVVNGKLVDILPEDLNQFVLE